MTFASLISLACMLLFTGCALHIVTSGFTMSTAIHAHPQVPEEPPQTRYSGSHRIATASAN